MATHKIGKLHFNLSKQGFAYRMGEGEIHRIYFGKKPKPTEEEYAPYPAEDDSDYAYDAPEAEEGAYYDEPEDEYGEPEDGYDDAPAEEYDDGYAEDAPGEYYEEGEPDEPQGGLYEYAERNIWVTLALLVVLPPLGIFLLWKLGKLEYPMRVGASVISAIWFIFILVLIFSGIFGGSSDTRQPAAMQLTTVTPVPSISASALPTSAPTADAGVTNEPTALATATPLPNQTSATGGNDVPEDQNAIVYSGSTGSYYHANSTCTNIGSTSVTPVTLQTAQNRNQTACPLCYSQTIYYARSDSKWYHTDQNCQDMKNASIITKAAAEAAGKTACPVCAGGTATQSPDADDGLTPAQRYAQTITNDKSGLKVWMTNRGENYHTSSTCRGMSGAKEVTLLAAMQSGKTACATCCAYLGKSVYATKGGKQYHLDKGCKGMENASSITLAAALVMGKTKCEKCVTDNLYSGDDQTDDSGKGVYVYARPDGRYYHSYSTCSNMQNASRVTLLSMIQQGRPACPVCCSTADDTVYAASGGKYYHSYATCSDMNNATSGTLAQALSYGYTRCPYCWSGSNDGGTTPDTGDDDTGDDTQNYSGMYVYGVQGGTYYHARKSCDRCPSDASRVLLEVAVRYGLTNCPDCAGEADDIVYAVSGGTRFHKNKTCSNMVNPVSGTMQSALMHGLTACNICYGGSGDTELINTHTYTSGKSGVQVYATVDGAYYHSREACWRITGTPAKITLETALNYGKTACPTCASSASKTVYATKGGKYYHYVSSCAGINASKGNLDSALAYGFAACPHCVTGTLQSSNTYKIGTSNVMVYSSIASKYFHANASCSGMKEVSYISLETALNYGKTACPVCASSASRVVYAKSGSGTYHASASCAGSGASSGTWAQALALGMKPCTICVTGEDSGDDYNEGESYAADGDTPMYIDINGSSSANTYHGYSDCEDSGMTNGTRVTLQFALEQGYKPCGYCDPPSSVK